VCFAEAQNREDNSAVFDDRAEVARENLVIECSHGGVLFVSRLSHECIEKVTHRVEAVSFGLE
jgi:hypothetical protein